MRQQGRCLLSTDEAGRALDRLAGLEEFIPPDLQRQVLNDTGRVNGRSCTLTHEVMLWVVLAMGIFTDVPIRQVFKLSRRFRSNEKTPARSSLCEGRQRLGVEPLQKLFDHLVRPLATLETPGAFYQGKRWMAMDGTVQDVPDSPANAVAFHRATGSRGTGAFPQVRKVSLVEVGTRVEVAFALGGWQDSENTLALDLVRHIPADAFLVMDRGFFSYSLWKMLDSRGVGLLLRGQSNFVLRPIRHLSDNSFLAKIYPNSSDRSYDRNGIVVRVIEYTLDDPQRTGHQEPHRLITNLLDAEERPALQLVCAYHERWEIELLFDEQKTHQDPIRPGKAAQLRSETPEGVRQELLALSLAHFVVRRLMFEAAQHRQIDPDRISFTGCLRILRCRLPECVDATPRGLQAWHQALVLEASREIIEPRRNRVNPRVVKRKMSKFAKKRPEHRRLPRLRKTFVESVVMT